MIRQYEVYGMKEAYWSWEFKIYERLDSMPIDRYYQYKGACYTEKEMKGTRIPHTYYLRNWFS